VQEVPAVNNQGAPVLTANSQRGGVAWVDYRLARSLPSVFFREVDGLTGRPTGRNLLMSPSEGADPGVAALTNGTFVVAWSDRTNVLFRVAGSAMISTPSRGLAPSLTAFDGGFLLAFADPTDLFGQRFDNQGIAIDLSPRPIGTGGRFGAKSAGALVGDGTSAVVGWETSAGVATSLVSLTGGAPIPGGTLATGRPARIDAIATGDGGTAMLGIQANGSGLIASVSSSLTLSPLAMVGAGSDAPSSLVELPNGDL
jgi:hypothetical protein